MTGTWEDRALCRTGESVPAEDWSARAELWFPDPGNRRLIERAKAICVRCPSAAECLAEALDKRHAEGIWGGLDEDERRQILRERSGRAA